MTLYGVSWHFFHVSKFWTFYNIFYSKIEGKGALFHWLLLIQPCTFVIAYPIRVDVRAGEVGHTIDRLPVHHGANAERETHPTVDLKWTVYLTFMSLKCGMNLDFPDGAHAGTTCTRPRGLTDLNLQLSPTEATGLNCSSIRLDFIIHSSYFITTEIKHNTSVKKKLKKNLPVSVWTIFRLSLIESD